MWEKILDFGTSVIQIGSLLLKNQSSIEKLQEQVGEMDTNMRLMAERLQRFSEKERDEHRINLLELKNETENLLRKNQDFIDKVNEVEGKMGHFEEMERAHHRNNLLELENKLLQMERRLPPAN